MGRVAVGTPTNQSTEVEGVGMMIQMLVTIDQVCDFGAIGTHIPQLDTAFALQITRCLGRTPQGGCERTKYWTTCR